MANLIKKNDMIEVRLGRLCAMQGLDPGFYVLAVHSFIERYLKEVVPHDPECTKADFPYYVDRFRERKDPEGRTLCRGKDLLSAICNEHLKTHGVRHDFDELSPFDAISATENLYSFLCLAGQSSLENMARLRDARDSWNDKRTKAELARELLSMGYKAQMAENGRSALMKEVEALRAGNRDREELAAAIASYEKEIADLKASSKEQSERQSELRSAKFNAEEKLRKLEKELEKFKNAGEYLERQRRLLGLSRSRKEYERFLLKLTAEQKDVLERIKLGGDFLVKGPAGTGKTLILIKAIEKARGAGNQRELSMDGVQGETVLLTYTRTLVKYDEYLSRIASEGSGAHRIQTADSYIGNLARFLGPTWRVDFDKLHAELARKHNATELTDAEFDAEVDQFIYGNAVSREEYIDLMIERRGRKKALSKPEREAVWKSLEAMEAEMESTRIMTKGYATKKILDNLETLKADPRFFAVDYIFIDEVQDLSAADLRVLKASARKCLVMAGDEDQAIFRPGFSFARAGISVIGRSRFLGRNFRNSFPILDLAERFRATIEGHEPEYEPASDRPGTPPEFFVSTEKEELLDLLQKRVTLFIDEHRYDPENLFVIAPRALDIASIKERLVSAGLRVKEPKDPDFDFEEEGVVRVTTMHSCKGLDAPVVFLYLPCLPFAGAGIDEAGTIKMHADMLYVSLTRAMDHLDVFVNPEANYPAIKCLLDCHASIASEITAD